MAIALKGFWFLVVAVWGFLGWRVARHHPEHQSFLKKAGAWVLGPMLVLGIIQVAAGAPFPGCGIMTLTPMGVTVTLVGLVPAAACAIWIFRSPPEPQIALAKELVHLRLSNEVFVWGLRAFLVLGIPASLLMWSGTQLPCG